MFCTFIFAVLLQKRCFFLLVNYNPSVFHAWRHKILHISW